MARITTPLTAAEVKNAKPKKKDYKLFDGGGLFLLVKVNGAKYWRMRYRFAGKEKQAAFGIYPQVSLADARQKRDELKAKLAAGNDPSAKAKEAAVKTAPTFRQVTDAFFDNLQHLKDAPTEGYRRKLYGIVKRHAFPFIGNVPVDEVTRTDVMAMIDTLTADGKHETARRVLQTIRRVYSYAITRDLIDRSPADGIKETEVIGRREHRHHPVNTDRKWLGGLLRAIESYGGDYTTKQALRLAPHVALRPVNIRRLKWEWIDFGDEVIDFPAEEMKQRKAFRLPLSKQAVAILEETRRYGGGEWVFPSVLKPHSPLSENTLNTALRRMGFTKDEINSHSFRGIFSTFAHKNGWDTLLVETALAHADSNRVRASYQHDDLIERRRELMQWYSDRLDEARAAV